MSVFNPELKENRESHFEANRFSPDLTRKLLKALDEGKEKYSDIIQCPVVACRNPLKIEMRKDSVLLKCTNCGLERVLRREK